MRFIIDITYQGSVGAHEAAPWDSRGYCNLRSAKAAALRDLNVAEKDCRVEINAIFDKLTAIKKAKLGLKSLTRDKAVDLSGEESLFDYDYYYYLRN